MTSEHENSTQLNPQLWRRRHTRGRVITLGVGVLVVGSTFGCAASVHNVSVQQTGCQSHEIEISEHQEGAGNETWVVTCGSHVFDCVRALEPFEAEAITVGGDTDSPLGVGYQKMYGTQTGETFCLLREE